MKLEEEVLKYEVVAVVDISIEVKETLRRNGLNEDVVVGLLTLESFYEVRQVNWKELKTSYFNMLRHELSTLSLSIRMSKYT